MIVRKCAKYPLEMNWAQPQIVSNPRIAASLDPFE